MTDKEKKNQIADILLDFYDEYDSNVINRPMIPNIYAGKILDSLQEEPVSYDLEEAAWLYYDKNRLPIPPEWNLNKEFIDSFKAGAEWGKNQAMAEIQAQSMALVQGCPKEEPVSIWHNASEKPEHENLLIETNDGKIIHRQSINNYGMVKRWAYTSDLLNFSNVQRTVKNLKEPVSDDLEEAADEYADGENPTCSCEECLIKTFKAGAQWQKEQLMKDAVDGIVCSQRGDMAIVKSSILFPTNLMKGEKVKLIIVKEDWR